jgi:enoyl-[acyl-carrier protein] reductase II
MQIKNRITGLLGVEYPIVQAPMGWIARSQLASAVCNAGGMGIIETSSGELDAVKGEIEKMRALTTKPFGVNVALAFVRDPGIVNFIIDQGVKFVTTSAGDPQKIVGPLKEAGLTVFHVVPSLKTALRAVECGVDGLVVEGGEGGGFKNPREVASMVLLPLVCEKVSVPVIAAGGMVDGHHGSRVCAGCRRDSDGDPHGVGGGVASPRELEECDSCGTGNRYRDS